MSDNRRAGVRANPEDSQRIGTTRVYRKAKTQLQLLTMAWWGSREVIDSSCQIWGRAWFPDLRTRDVGNYRKIITDALIGVAYLDDSQLYRETWERCGVDRLTPRIAIIVTPFDPALAERSA